jgi:LacI family transcriptional regulator
VNVAIAELGRRAFELLERRLQDGEEDNQREILPTTLVIRESCGARLRSEKRYRGGAQ